MTALSIGALLYAFVFGALLGMVAERWMYGEHRAAVLAQYDHAVQALHQQLMDLEKCAR